MKNPSKWVYPKFISEPGKKIWNTVIVERRKDIRRFKSTKEQWAAALIIYKRSCVKNRIMPFTEKAIPSKTEINKADAQNVLNTIFLENKRANEEIETIAKGVEGHFRSLKQQTFGSAEYENGFYSIIFTRILSLNKEVPVSWLFTYLGFKHGFSRVGRLIATKPIGRMTELVVKPDPKNKYQAIISIKAKLTRNHAILLSGSDDSLITKRLEKKMASKFKSSKYPKRREVVLGIVSELEKIGEEYLASRIAGDVSNDHIDKAVKSVHKAHQKFVEEYAQKARDTFQYDLVIDRIKSYEYHNRETASEKPVEIGQKVEFYFNWDRRGGYTLGGTVKGITPMYVKISSMGKIHTVPKPLVSHPKKVEGVSKQKKRTRDFEAFRKGMGKLSEQKRKEKIKEANKEISKIIKDYRKVADKAWNRYKKKLTKYADMELERNKVVQPFYSKYFKLRDKVLKKYGIDRGTIGVLILYK